MSNSMISTVLEIERDAENILAKADADALAMCASAHDERKAATARAEQDAAREIAEIEAKTAADRESKVRELTATGNAALDAVKHISDATYESGVQYVLAALS